MRDRFLRGTSRGEQVNIELTTKEKAELEKWNQEHLKEQHDGKEPYCGAIGGRLTFTFCMTTLGGISGVECNLCNAANKGKLVYMHCLSDFADW